MKPTNQLSLTKKLALAIVVTGLVPALVIGFLAIHTANHMAGDIAGSYEVIAKNIGEKIDRNLFERYGDVQAFGANDAVNDTNSWYQAGSAKNKIAAAANRYANLYGFYLLSYLVDLDGKVIAVNDADPAGKAIDTTALYQKNFKDAEWFKESLAGHFLKTDILDGTYVQDVHADEDVKKVYGGDGLVLGFAAPVKDAGGKIIGVWHNCANFSLVEEVIATSYAQFKQDGLSEAALTLIDHTGRVIVDYNPVANGGKDAVQHDANVLLKLNLADAGVSAARDLVAGKGGAGVGDDAQKHSAQVAGYAVCDGELGFAGLKWGVLVRVPKHQALAAMSSQIWHISYVILGSIAGLIAMGLWLGRSISRPLALGISAMRTVGDEVAHASEEFSTSSQTVAEGASEQAASLEETSASLEEISSMTKRNSENATNAAALGRQSRDSASAGLDRLNELSHTLNSIKSAVGEMQSAVSEMQTSSQQVAKIIKTIDEIAFQTNLLALNAAVEAARAGEAGMGFAVVADEVRALAQRSAQAAKDTSEKIEAAVKRSELGGVASAKVVKSLTEVEATAQSIEQVFNGIVTQIKSLDEVIAEIAAASKEQSQGVGEVNMAVSQMDKVTQSNAAAAEENAAAASEMNNQARTLQQAVTELEAVVIGTTSGAPADKPAPPAAPQTVKVPKPKAATKAAKPVARKASLTVAPPAAPAADDFDIPMPDLGGESHTGSFKDF